MQITCAAFLSKVPQDFGKVTGPENCSCFSFEISMNFFLRRRFHFIHRDSPVSTTVLSASELNVEGLMIWGQRRQSSEWIEPFSARVRISEMSGGELSYEIKCGNAIRGLAQVPYTMSPKRAEWIAAREWLSTFSRDMDRQTSQGRRKDVNEISELVQREILRITDAKLVRRIRELLVTPYQVKRARDYGAPDEHFICWVRWLSADLLHRRLFPRSR
jgi:hypothetical protein